MLGNYLFGIPVPVERLVDGGTVLLQLLVCLRAGWHHPRTGASDQGRGGEQAGVIELGLRLGQRGRKHTARRGISYGEGTIRSKGFKKGHEMGGDSLLSNTTHEGHWKRGQDEKMSRGRQWERKRTHCLNRYSWDEGGGQESRRSGGHL